MNNNNNNYHYYQVTAERPPTPPTAPLGRPPLPRGISTPVSATTYHSRWVICHDFHLCFANFEPSRILIFTQHNKQTNDKNNVLRVRWNKVPMMTMMVEKTMLVIMGMMKK